MIIINFTNRPIKTNGIVLLRNPRWWQGEIEPKITHVVSDDPRIIEAYAARGVPEFKEELDDEDNTKLAYNKYSVPENWDRMTWQELRSLAASLAPHGVKIKNKQDAEEVIKAVLDREGGQ